jgi:hypothetical protein
MRKTVEEFLREIEQRAALLRFLAYAGALSPEHLDENGWYALGDLLGEMERRARRVQRALSAEQLNNQV